MREAGALCDIRPRVLTEGGGVFTRSKFNARNRYKVHQDGDQRRKNVRRAEGWQAEEVIHDVAYYTYTPIIQFANLGVRLPLVRTPWGS